MYSIEIHPDQQADQTYYTYSIDGIHYQHAEMPVTEGAARKLANEKVRELKANAKRRRK